MVPSLDELLLIREFFAWIVCGVLYYDLRVILLEVRDSLRK